MAISVNDKDLGLVTAYAYAVAGGYTGTEAEFEELLGNIAEDLSEIENLSVTVDTLPAGSSATASYSNGVLHLGIPKGDKGDKGDPGVQGPTGNGIQSITKTGTSGLVDTYTILFTNGTSTTFEVTNGEDGEVTTAQMTTAIAAALADYAKVDGSYSSFTAGNAEQLVSTVGVTEQTPYLFRTTGGSADVGDRVKLSEITGGTVAWNQLVELNKPSATVGAITFTVDSSSGTVTVNGNDSEYREFTISVHDEERYIKDHKYYVSKGVDNNNARVVVGSTGSSVTTGLNKKEAIVNCTKSASSSTVLITTAQGAALFDNVVFTPQIIDLTQMLGSTIADYLYTLESGTDGAGVAKLKSWGFCTKPYYAYDAGSLLSAKTSAHKEIGFNQWDEQWEVGSIFTSTGNNSDTQNDRIRSKNYIPVIPSITYYIRGARIQRFYYDADKNYIGFESGFAGPDVTFSVPDGTAYMRFITTNTYGTTYNHDICINLHGERDGEYEPYVEYNYPLDSDLELRGLPELDENNNLRYNGDVYTPDGNVSRNYAILENQTGAIGDTITLTGLDTSATDIVTSVGHLADVGTLSGTTLTLTRALSGAGIVYPLATPTTESEDPYQEIQVCAGDGTEQFVDTRTVAMPVGYTALYMADLRSKLESAPENPPANGDYIVRKTNSGIAYVPLIGELPTDPAEDGTYSLKVTVADGVATLSWEADT